MMAIGACRLWRGRCCRCWQIRSSSSRRAVTALERQLLAWHKTDAVSQRLASIPGIGPIIATAIVAKQIELAREIVPAASKIGLLTNLKDPKAPPQAHELEDLARALQLKIFSADANRPEELEGALQLLASELVDVV